MVQGCKMHLSLLLPVLHSFTRNRVLVTQLTAFECLASTTVLETRLSVLFTQQNLATSQVSVMLPLSGTVAF